MTAANAPAVAAICRQLDGIPLALELAAPRVRSMSVEEVSARLARAFKLLTGGSPTALPRQRTLRSLIEWSYGLLDEREQSLFSRLATFSGGWTLEAAEHACSGEGIEQDDVVEVLSALCDKSLVVADESGGATRYRLLETVRQYALERLMAQGEEARWKARHFAWVMSLATSLSPLLSGPHQKDSLTRLDTEHDNLRGALAWSVRGGGDPTAGLQLANAIARFWRVRHYLAEARTWFGELLAATDHAPPSAARASALTAHGTAASKQGDLATARTLHERGLAMARTLGDRSLIAAALGNLVIVAIEADDYATAKTMQEQLLAERRAFGDPRTIASSLGRLGVIDIQLGELASARAALEEALRINRTLRDPAAIANTLFNLAVLASFREDYATAHALGSESLAIAREVGDRGAEAQALSVLGTIACARGDLETGTVHLRASLVAHRDLGASYGTTEVCDYLASACRHSRPAHAARIWGGVERVRAERGYLKRPFLRPQHARHVAEARAALGDDATFDAAWQEGRALSLDEVVACALGET
jgi:non-specific serine/threonine protein kinase